MKRIDIIKEYVNYVKDTKKDYTKTKTKQDFTKQYMLYYVKLNGIKDFEEKRKEVENTLKYNPLTIAKLIND